MDLSFNTSISGIRTALTRNEVSANNVANVNTPGFGQSSVYQAETPPGGVRVASIARTPNPDPAISGTDLAKETGEQIQNKNTLSANLKVLKVKDAMLGELIDMIA
jgi:flagellar hook protein FlgE